MGVVMILMKWKIYTVAMPRIRRGWPGSSFLLVSNQALAVQYNSVFKKTQIKYLKHFITIKLLEKAYFLGIADK